MLDLLTRQLKEAILAPLSAPFKSVHPNVLTFLSLLAGIICAYFAAVGEHTTALIWWITNRTLDGLDGVVARRFKKTSDFGGYLDIVVDFFVYGIIPLGIAIGEPSFHRFVIVCALEITYFVNAAGLFQLSAILEKRALGAKSKSELTTVTMPPALIEGTETVIFYSLFMLLPVHVDALFVVFGSGVTISIMQRLFWAYKHLK